MKNVEILPQRFVAKSLGRTKPLRAVAHYADGTSRDVTEWTIFSAEDSSAVSIDAETSTPSILRPGRHVVVARYLSEVVPIELLAPMAVSRVGSGAEGTGNLVVQNFIDEEVLDLLATLRLPPSPQIDDVAFLRRITLDLTGRLPTEKRVRSVLQDGLDRASLIDELLASEEFTQFWTMRLAQLLRIRPRNNDPLASSVYHAWLGEQVRQGFSYQEFAKTLLTASGDTHEFGPASFFRTTKDARTQAEFVSELFMGSRLRCANCHNHPLDRWTQDDYHGLAAIFATVDADQIVRHKPSGVTIHPRTLEAAEARIPGENMLTNDGIQPRQEFATWLTDPENPYFAKAIVNRLWKYMLGRGLVEPVDDFRNTNQPRIRCC